MSTVFLSYARQNREPARALAADLRELGNTVWLDEELSGGQIWWDHILAQICHHDLFVFGLSPAALESLACRRESDYAAALGKPILPILLAGEVSLNRFPPALAAIQYVDYRERTIEGSFRLSRALSMLPPASPLPDPLPNPPEVPLSYLNQLAAQIAGNTLLSYEEQSVLVLDLRRSLSDPDTADDARALLSQLRQRRDLLALVAEEIDARLGTSPAMAAELEQAQADLVALEAVHAESDRRLVETTEALETITAEHDQLIKERNDLRAELAQVIDERDALQARLDEPPAPRLNSLDMSFVRIPAGEFLMGSPEHEAGRQENEDPQRRVTISEPFDLSQFLVTQAQWEAVMGSNPSRFKAPSYPVTNVSFENVQAFLQKLNARGEGHYRLPTEAEWEYACRAGTTTAYSFGDDPALLGEYGWYEANADGRPHPVGELTPNPWALYDLHGNVWEWVQDWYGPYIVESVTDPAGPATGAFRVIRGGSWVSSAQDARSALRYWFHPGDRDDYLGFRCLSSGPSQ